MLADLFNVGAVIGTDGVVDVDFTFFAVAFRDLLDFLALSFGRLLVRFFLLDDTELDIEVINDVKVTIRLEPTEAF